MKMFSISQGLIEPDEMAYSIKPFRVLLDRDSTEEKEIAIGELSYIFFMVDPRSDFVEVYKNEEIRSVKAIENCYGLPDNWKPDSSVKAAMLFYSEMIENVYTRLLSRAESAVEKIGLYLDSVDLFEVDNNGKQVHDVNKLTGAIDKLPKMTKALIAVKKDIEKELKEKSGTRGSAQPGMFEDKL